MADLTTDDHAEHMEESQAGGDNGVVHVAADNATDRCGSFRAYMISWLVIVLYVLVGGAAFMMVESRDWIPDNGSTATDRPGNDTETFSKPNMDLVRLELLHSLRDVWASDPGNWTDEAVKYLSNYDRQVEQIQAALLNAEAEADNHRYTRRHFGDWFNACFFCLTVITSIGYGHLIPVTSAGYGLLLVYTVVGIPLFFIYIFKLGELLAVPIKRVYLSCCTLARRQASALVGRRSGRANRNFKELENGEDDKRVKRRGRGSDQEEAILSDDFGVDAPEQDNIKVEFQTDDISERSPDDVEIPVVVLMLVVFIYVLICAAIFSAMEGWPYAASAYFSVITITTVGFGDYIPDTDPNTKHFFISFYIVTGLLLLSICINLMLSRISKFADWFFNLKCCTEARCLKCCST
ncbi:TWiK family of potassium channels protein 18-like [Ptychodera flava]|uniref:TWiK family of potassium channels protein 18-like n=1 Tax=Ptychodera flava TaxID=63121 RepID=UPI003969F8FF